MIVSQPWLAHAPEQSIVLRQETHLRKRNEIWDRRLRPDDFTLQSGRIGLSGFSRFLESACKLPSTKPSLCAWRVISLDVSQDALKQKIAQRETRSFPHSRKNSCLTYPAEKC